MPTEPRGQRPRALMALTLVGLLFTTLLAVPTRWAQAQTGAAPAATNNWPAPSGVSAKAWILIDLSTGQSLAGSRESTPTEPGGLSVLMTAYLSFNALRERQIRMQQVLPGPTEDEVPAGPRMFLGPDGAKVRDLLTGLMLMGAHDAAVSLAKGISGSEEAFVALMNQTAERLGLRNTRFTNASGARTENPSAQTTAQEMAALAIQLYVEFPEAFQIANQREITFNGIRQTNRNRLLWLDRSVDGLIAIDHPTQASGLVTAQRPQPIGPREQMQRRLMVVVLQSTSAEVRAQETLELLNFGFQQFDVVRLFARNAIGTELEVFKGIRSKLKTEFRQDVLVAAPRKRFNELRTELQTGAGLVAPVTAGQRVGSLRIFMGPLQIHEVDLVAAESVKSAGLLGRAIDSVRLWARAPFHAPSTATP
jgi:serine-type D-Ala-D-Ala carboxypeptidase (penicillin-binding protein 5/6)